MIGFEGWMAGRMLISRKRVGLISWSGIISILGVATGCFALIVSVAILNGFEQEVRNKVVGFEADLRITEGESPIEMEQFSFLLFPVAIIVKKGKTTFNYFAFNNFFTSYFIIFI